MSRWPGNAQRERTSFGGLRRGQLMSLVRSTGNRTTEGRLAVLLREAGLAGWRRHQALPGRPDFVWRRARVAVFVDGCFWHGCPIHATQPKQNADFWRQKIARNQARDRLVTRTLRRAGWRVVRLWEHELTRKYEKRLRARLRRAGLLDAPAGQGRKKPPPKTASRAS